MRPFAILIKLVVPILTWFVIGRLLDWGLGTGPWLTFAGALLGTWVGLVIVWQGGRSHDPDGSRPPAMTVE